MPTLPGAKPLAVLLAIAFAIALVDRNAGIRTWLTLREDLRQAEERIERLRTEVAVLEQNRGGLESDPFALERAIRERLELAREGETIVRVSSSRDTSPRIP